MNKIRKYLNNIDPKVQVTAILVVAIIGGGWMLYTAVVGVNEIYDEARAGLIEQKTIRREAVEKVKAECKLTHTELGRVYNTYTYACDDGVEYTFEE